MPDKNQLSPHFKKSEFNQRGSPLAIDDYQINPALVEKLEKLRTLIGNKPIRITSGFRSEAYNKKIGGAKFSQHMGGNAADIMVDGINSKELEKLAKKAGFSYTQTYADKPHLHVDVRTAAATGGKQTQKVLPKNVFDFDPRFFYTLWDETSGGTPDEVGAAASVMLNRYLREGPDKMYGGFSGYEKNPQYQKAASGNFTDTENSQYQNNYKIVQGLLDNPATILPYTHFENVQQYGEPSWAKGVKDFKDIGRQRFYNLSKTQDDPAIDEGWTEVSDDGWQEVPATNSEGWVEVSSPAPVSALKFATMPISKLITGKSIGERTNFLNKRQDALMTRASESIAKGGKAPSTAGFFVKSLPHSTAQALINFFDLSPLDVGIMVATAGAGKLPAGKTGLTIGDVASKVPIGKGFKEGIRYQQTLKSITPLSSRGIPGIISPDTSLPPAEPSHLIQQPAGQISEQGKLNFQTLKEILTIQDKKEAGIPLTAYERGIYNAYQKKLDNPLPPPGATSPSPSMPVGGTPGTGPAVSPVPGLAPETRLFRGQALSKVNLTKYEPEIQEAVARQIDSDPNLLARKVIPHSELIAMAEELKSTPIVRKILSMPEGQQAAEILKLRQGEDAIVRATLKTDFDNLASAIKETIAKQQTQGIGRLASEAGRTLEQFKIPIEAQAERAALINQRIAEARRYKGIGKEEKQRIIDGLVEFRKVVTSRDFNPDWFDKGYEFWLNNLLSGLWTQTVNATSNVMFGQILKPVEKAAYSTTDAFLSLFTKKREHYFSEIPEQVKGIGKSMTSSLLPVPIPKKGTSKLLSSPVGAIQGVKGEIIRLPTTALAIADNVSKRIVGFSELLGRAEAIARQEGLKGSALIARKNQLIANPTNQLIEQVNKEQLYRTFQDVTGMGQLLQPFRGIKGVRWIQPFINTLSSIITKAYERTPAGFIGVGVKAAKSSITKGVKPYPQYQAAVDVGNAALGTGMFAMIYAAYKRGTITGAPPKDKAQRDLFYRQGKQPYAVLYNDKYIPISRLEPYGTAVMQMTDFIQGYNESDKELPIDKLTDSVFKLTYSFANKTFLSGLTNFVGMLSDPERYGETFFGRFAAGFVPFGGMQRNIQQMADLTVRAPEGVAQRVMTQIPGLAQKVPQRVSSMGELVSRKPIGLSRFLPFPITRAEHDEVANELERLGMTINYPDKKITFPSTKTGEVKEESIKLTREEYDHLLMQSGGMIVKNLQALFASKQYQQLNNDFLRQKLVSAFIEDVRTRTRTGAKIKKMTQE